MDQHSLPPEKKTQDVKQQEKAPETKKAVPFINANFNCMCGISLTAPLYSSEGRIVGKRGELFYCRKCTNFMHYYCITRFNAWKTDKRCAICHAPFKPSKPDIAVKIAEMLFASEKCEPTFPGCVDIKCSCCNGPLFKKQLVFCKGCGVCLHKKCCGEKTCCPFCDIPITSDDFPAKILFMKLMD